MKNYMICGTIDELTGELKKHNISKIVLAVIDEKRSRQIDKTTVQVVDVKRNEIIAYKDAMIYKCVLEDVETNDIYEKLMEQGFEVKRTSRNIV